MQTSASQLSLDDQIKLAQIAKTEAETEKLKKEAFAVRVEETKWLEGIKLIGGILLGIGGGVAAYTQYEMGELRAKVAKDDLGRFEAAAVAAVTKRDAAIRELNEAKAAVGELKTSLSQSESELKVAKPAAVRDHLTYIQFKGSIKRELINELQTALKSKGFNAPGSERVAGDYTNQIKYFRTEDKAAAETLSATVQAFFVANQCPVTLPVVQVTTGKTNSPLEVWLSHSCTPGQLRQHTPSS